MALRTSIVSTHFLIDSFPTLPWTGHYANRKSSIYSPHTDVKSGTWGHVLIDRNAHERLALKVMLSYENELCIGIVRELATYALVHRAFGGDAHRIAESGLNVCRSVFLMSDPSSRLVACEPRTCTPALLQMPLFQASGHDISPVADRALLKHIIHRTLVGIATLHSLGIMHRDVKPGNILVDEASGRVALTDYGLAKMFEVGSSGSSESLGLVGTTVVDQHSADVFTLCYRPPEVLMLAPYDFAADLWALGMSALHMASGNFISQRTGYATLLGIFSLLGSEAAVRLPSFAGLEPFPFPRWTAQQCSRRLRRWAGPLAQDPAAMDLVRRLLHFDPESRITAREALAHPWFSDMPAPQLRTAPPPVLGIVAPLQPHTKAAANAIILRCVERDLMSVSAAYLSHEFLLRFCEAAEEPAPVHSQTLIGLLACILLATTLADSETVTPVALWNVAGAEGLVDEEDEWASDQDVAFMILREVNAIMRRAGCDLWIRTLCSQKPRVQQSTLWKRLVAALLVHVPASHPELRGHGALQFMEELALEGMPGARHSQLFAFVVNLVGDRVPELREIYTRFVHRNYADTCQCIAASLAGGRAAPQTASSSSLDSSLGSEQQLLDRAEA
jgi:hypothetical protein